MAASPEDLQLLSFLDAAGGDPSVAAELVRMSKMGVVPPPGLGDMPPTSMLPFPMPGMPPIPAPKTAFAKPDDAGSVLPEQCRELGLLRDI